MIKRGISTKHVRFWLEIKFAVVLFIFGETNVEVCGFFELSYDITIN